MDVNRKIKLLYERYLELYYHTPITDSLFFDGYNDLKTELRLFLFQMDRVNRLNLKNLRRLLKMCHCYLINIKIEPIIDEFLKKEPA